MKRCKTPVLFLLALLYCFAAGMSGHSTYEVTTKKVPLHQEESFSKVTAKFSVHTPAEQFKLADVAGEKKFTPNFKFFIGCLASHYVPDTFSQYTSYSQDFLARFSKPDIIFPFHYFW